MRRAIAEAAVGDEQKREDPTVNELQARVAELLGQEEAIFLPTATMANQIALKLQSRPGDVLIAEEHAHVVIYEYGGAAVHAGLVTLGAAGRARAAHARSRCAPPPSRARRSPTSAPRCSRSRTRTTAPAGVSGRSTSSTTSSRPHASSGSRCTSTARGCSTRRSRSASRRSAIAARFDTVTLCLSKGLGCPLGALLAGSRELMARAWREKHLFGGAMRQAGIVAAAGVYALDHHVERLADDHARAQRLAEASPRGGRPGRPRAGRDELRPDRRRPARPRAGRRAGAAHRAAGVGLSATIHPSVMRAVTHLEVTDEDIARAAELIPEALLADRRA